MEYFNSRGLHPETMNALKPIIKYRIRKYIKVIQKENANKLLNHSIFN